MDYGTYCRTQPRGSVRRLGRVCQTEIHHHDRQRVQGELVAGLALTVQEFLVPSHLDGFELRFIGGRGVAGKAGEFGDPLVHVGEADGDWIGVRMFVGQSDGYIFKIVPTECWRHRKLLTDRKEAYITAQVKSTKNAPTARAMSPYTRIAKRLTRSVVSRRITDSFTNPATNPGYFAGETSKSNPARMNSNEKMIRKILRSRSIQAARYNVNDRVPWRSFCSNREFPPRCRWCRRGRSGSRGATLD